MNKFFIMGFFVASFISGLVGVGSLFSLISVFGVTGALFVGGWLSFVSGLLIIEFYGMVFKKIKLETSLKEKEVGKGVIKEIRDHRDLMDQVDRLTKAYFRKNYGVFWRYKIKRGEHLEQFVTIYRELRKGKKI